MAPVNDLIANAIVIPKGYQEFSGTTVGAGFSDEGAAGYNEPSVWYKIDTVLLQNSVFYIEVDADYPVYGELYAIADDTPDAEQLLLGTAGSFVNDFGNGSNSFSQLIFTNTGGSPPDFGDGIKYFLYISDYPFDGTTGNFSIKLCSPFSVKAIDDPNTSSSTVTVLADAVKDVQYNVENNGFNEDLQHVDGTDTFYARGDTIADGQYYVSFRMRKGNTNAIDVGVGIVRNDVPILPIRYEDYASGAVVTADFKPMETGGNYAGDAMAIANPLRIRSGDTIAFRAFVDDNQALAFSPANWPEILYATFYPALAGPPFTSTILTTFDEQAVAAPSTPRLYEYSELNLGATTTLRNMAKGNEDASTGTWGDINGHGITILPNGNVYIAWIEETSGFPATWNMWMKVWDGNDWTLVSDDVWDRGDGVSTYRGEGGVSLDNDGTNVYVAWSERKIDVNENYWRCKKYDPGTDTFTELGSSTGQSKYETMWFSKLAAWYEAGGPRIKISPGGVPWVGFSEPPTQNWEELTSFAGSAADLSGGTDGWNALSGGTPLRRDGSGNAYSASSSAEGISYRTDAVIGQNLTTVSQCTVASVSTTDGDYIELFIHLGDPTLGTFDGYRARVTRATTNDSVSIVRIDNGVPTTLVSSSMTGHIAVDDKLIFARQASSGTISLRRWVAATPNVAAQILANATGATTYNSLNLNVIGAGVFGQAYSIADFGGGDANPNSGSMALPYLWYWDGSQWVDSELPEPTTKRTAWWNVAEIQEPINHIDFTFCHADGPNEYPSAVYNVRWNTTTTDSFEFVYWEYNGTSWVNSIQKRANLIYSNLKSNTNNGHWHQGMCVLNNGIKPYIVANLGSGVFGFDYTAVWTVEDDASDFLAIDDPYPSKANLVFNNIQWDPWGAEAAFTDSQTLLVVEERNTYGGMEILVNKEVGTDVGWSLASPTNDGWASQNVALCIHQVKWFNNKLYIITQTNGGVLGVWTLTPLISGKAVRVYPDGRVEVINAPQKRVTINTTGEVTVEGDTESKRVAVTPSGVVTVLGA